MKVTAPKKAQLSLDFEPGLVERYRNLRDVVSTSIYKRGLTTCAIDLNESPGNLSNQLSDESQRKFGIDEFETYLEKSKDYTPIFYLVEKFLAKEEKDSSDEKKKLKVLADIQVMLKNAGMA